MKPRHQLRCMGQPALFAPNGDPIRFRTKKHLALLVYLAVEGMRSHRRDRLAELLWPKAETAEARHSLATALSILRPLLGINALTTSREQVSLDHDRLSLDLERLVSQDVLGGETSGALDVAPFLEGFDIPDAPEFAMWKDRQQARLLPMIKDALVILMHRRRRSGESRLVEQLAERMLSLDEFSEEAVIAKMEARALAGDRLTALKLFEDWKARLYVELGAAPSVASGGGPDAGNVSPCGGSAGARPMARLPRCVSRDC
jgi:DNA-binding SARP family transcriptional activator